MHNFELLKKIFSFDDTSAEFELLESENGLPDETERFLNEPAARPKPGEQTYASQAHINPDDLLAEDIEKNVRFLKMAMMADQNKDFILRRLELDGVKCAVAYMTGMADSNTINDFILRQCLNAKLPQQVRAGGDLLKHIAENVVTVGEIATEEKWPAIIGQVLDGMCAMLVEGQTQAIMLETRGFEKRSIGSPIVEKIVMGPQESFSESLRTNITQVRRIVRTPDLIAEMVPLGGENNMGCAILFRSGIANERLVEEVRKRITRIKTDYLMGEGMLEQLIEGRKHSPLPQTMATERPDRAAALLMSGHVAVLCEGSPFAVVMPVSLLLMGSLPEDVYLRPLAGSIVRIVRYVAALVSILLPGMYVSLVMFNQGVFSTDMINTIMAARRLIALPVGTEMILLLFIYELVRIAGQSVPGSTGNTVGIIGGLLLGQAAVSANLVSSVMIIVIAVSGLGSYAIPDYALQFPAVVFKLIFILAGMAAGLFGVAVAGTVALVYICSLKSFGMPMLAPFAPKTNTNRPAMLRGLLGNKAVRADEMNMQTEGGGNA